MVKKEMMVSLAPYVDGLVAARGVKDCIDKNPERSCKSEVGFERGVEIE